MFSNVPKSFWFQFVPVIILGLLTIVLLVTGTIPLFYLISTFIMWILVSGLGIAVGYHRVFSHKTHSLPVWKENIILFFATFAAQGASIIWVAVHRGYHHPYTDKEKDIHSPVVYGILHSFVGWQYNNTQVNVKYAVDLLRKPNHVWFHKHQLKVLWGVPLVVALFNWQLALTAFCLVSFIGVLQDNLINVLGHLKGIIGYRNYATKDNSYNNIILGYLAWGHGWHNNHHHTPAAYDFGTGISGKWWEWDPCNIFKPFLKSFN
jgi:fatty-acid desaturase